MGIEPTHSRLWCDALPVQLPSPWEEGTGEGAYLMYDGHKNLALVYVYLFLHHLACGKGLGTPKSVGMTNLGTCM